MPIDSGHGTPANSAESAVIQPAVVPTEARVTQPLLVEGLACQAEP